MGMRGGLGRKGGRGGYGGAGGELGGYVGEGGGGNGEGGGGAGTVYSILTSFTWENVMELSNLDILNNIVVVKNPGRLS